VQEDGGGASGAAASKRSIHVSQSARILRPGAQTRSPYDLCLVEDFDILDALWHEGFKSLHADVRSSPVMISEPPYAPPSQRERTAELLFEGHGVPFLYLARAPVCQAFSVGRTSAIVVDIGASATRVTPVVEGYALNAYNKANPCGTPAISPISTSA
jgi:actin-related protein